MNGESSLPATPHVRPSALTSAQLQEALARLSHWGLVERPHPRAPAGAAQELHRRFAFASFEDAMKFMAAASPRITQLDHHPEWSNRYKTVSVWLTTWEIGYQPSPLDVELAGHLDELHARFSGT